MQNKGCLVLKDIAPSEICLRCIFQPLYIKSNGLLKREALLPPPNRNRNDVSLLRQNYMSLEECISHGKNTHIDKQSFVAIASITRKDVQANNLWAHAKDSTGYVNGTTADIYYAPMSNGKYISLDIDVFSNDPDVDLPAHADLRYDSVLSGTVQTRMRQYASELVKKMRTIYHVDAK